MSADWMHSLILAVFMALWAIIGQFTFHKQI